MKTVGGLLIFIGIAVGMYAFFMETSVPTDNTSDRLTLPDRVVNLDLINRKQSTLFVAGVMCIAGAIFLSAAYVADSFRDIQRTIEPELVLDKQGRAFSDSQQTQGDISNDQRALLYNLNTLIKKEAHKIISGENSKITDLLKKMISDKDEFLVLNERYKEHFNKGIIDDLTSISSSYATTYYYVEPLIELGICKKEFPHTLI